MSEAFPSIRDDRRPWKLSNFQDPLPPLSIYIQNSSTPLTLDVQFQTTTHPLQMITNQLNENIIQRELLCSQVLQVGFRFQDQLINLVWLSFNFFSLAEASLSAFSWLYTPLCAVAQKCHEMSFIYNYSHFKYILILFFFLAGFSFTTVHESQDCRGRGRAFL